MLLMIFFNRKSKYVHIIYKKFFFSEMSLQQYLHYLPVPTIDAETCNSTKHYNGHIDNDKICAGYTDSDKTPCYVSINEFF